MKKFVLALLLTKTGLLVIISPRNSYYIRQSNAKQEIQATYVRPPGINALAGLTNSGPHTRVATIY